MSRSRCDPLLPLVIVRFAEGSCALAGAGRPSRSAFACEAHQRLNLAARVAPPLEWVVRPQDPDTHLRAVAKQRLTF